jgi:hypothetical protein
VDAVEEACERYQPQSPSEQGVVTQAHYLWYSTWR